MSPSQKWGPQVFHHIIGKSCESFSREASANVPLKVRQASSRTILFLNNDTEVLTVRQSNVRRLLALSRKLRRHGPECNARTVVLRLLERHPRKLSAPW